MRIRIIGGSGCGKTYLAEKLSKKYGIDHYDLDDLQWDNTANTYGVKRDKAERDRLLQDILNKDDWILEGVYYTWCAESFANADTIYVLNTPRRVYRRRIIRRFIRRKIGIEKGKRETIKTLKNLLQWADKYQREDMTQIREMLSAYQDKVKEIVT